MTQMVFSAARKIICLICPICLHNPVAMCYGGLVSPGWINPPLRRLKTIWPLSF